MHGFDSELSLHLLNKSQTPNTFASSDRVESPSRSPAAARFIPGGLFENLADLQSRSTRSGFANHLCGNAWADLGFQKATLLASSGVTYDGGAHQV
jgi:hypothetical protein